MRLTTVLFGASLAALVMGHAVMITPANRRKGPNQTARCGPGLTDDLDRDKAGPIEATLSKIDQYYNVTACNPYLCRGYQFEGVNVLNLSAGASFPVHIDLIAGHRPGYANVSVIDTRTNKFIGAPLVTWAAWPDSTSGPPRNDTDFTVTIPSGLSNTCATAGICVIQWHWYAINNKQTYQNCIDFTIV